MSDTGKQSPLGVNVLGTLLQHQGFYINPKVRNLAGQSKTNEQYAPGAIVNDTALYWITYAINDAYNRGYASGTDISVAKETYENLINVGQSRIPALGNSPPPSYVAEDPSGVWNGEATSGYWYEGDVGPGQSATWYPFKCVGSDANPNIGASQWGWVRLIALQAWNEFNYNGETNDQEVPQYQYFLQSFLGMQGFVDYSNKAIFATEDSKEFLKGIYSNMDDLTSADITGVSLANRAFGQDLINLGKALDLSTIATFGLPSNLLKILKKTNALSTAVNYVLLASGLSNKDITNILNDGKGTYEQEVSLYAAFSAIKDVPLKETLQVLNCKTKGITSLADLLNVKKLFPISYQSLTVPIYNTVPNPTNSKTYYLLFVKGELNPQLIAPAVVEQTEPVIPPLPPPPVEPPPLVVEETVSPPVQTPEQVIIETPNLPPVSVPKGGGGGCVALESYVPCVEMEMKHNGRLANQAWMLEPGMSISLGTDLLKIENGQVVKAVNDLQPCVKITTIDGISLICSTTAPIYTKEQGYVLSTELNDKHVAVMKDNKVWFSKVTSITDEGTKFVRVIDTGDNSFWAGEKDGEYILHHNVNFDRDTLDYDKK